MRILIISHHITLLLLLSLPVLFLTILILNHQKVSQTMILFIILNHSKSFQYIAIHILFSFQDIYFSETIHSIHKTTYMTNIAQFSIRLHYHSRNKRFSIFEHMRVETRFSKRTNSPSSIKVLAWNF